MIGFVQAASLLGSATGALFANKKDPERVATAQANLTKALAGDTVAYAALVAQANGSATQVGKDAATRALQAYAQQKATFITPPTQTPLQQQVSTTVDAVRTDLAKGVQNIGAGATTGAANAISPGSGVTIPLTRTQLLILGAIAAAVIYLRR